jgi:hypothetical protein
MEFNPSRNGRLGSGEPTLASPGGPHGQRHAAEPWLRIRQRDGDQRCRWQLKFGRLFTRPADQPRHATIHFSNPGERSSDLTKDGPLLLASEPVVKWAFAPCCQPSHATRQPRAINTSEDATFPKNFVQRPKLMLTRPTESTPSKSKVDSRRTRLTSSAQEAAAHDQPAVYEEGRSDNHPEADALVHVQLTCGLAYCRVKRWCQ